MFMAWEGTLPSVRRLLGVTRIKTTRTGEWRPCQHTRPPLSNIGYGVTLSGTSLKAWCVDVGGIWSYFLMVISRSPVGSVRDPGAYLVATAQHVKSILYPLYLNSIVILTPRLHSQKKVQNDPSTFDQKFNKYYFS